MNLNEAMTTVLLCDAILHWRDDSFCIEGTLTLEELEAMLIVARARLNPPPANSPPPAKPLTGHLVSSPDCMYVEFGALPEVLMPSYIPPIFTHQNPPPADEPSDGDLTLTEACQIIESDHLENYLSPIGMGDIPTYPDYLTDRQMRAIDLVNFANSITYQGY